MARVTIYTCDTCGREAPAQHARTFPADDWYTILGGYDTGLYGADVSACSIDCLVKVARQLRGDGDTIDELEALLAAPSAVKSKPATRPRTKKRD